MRKEINGKELYELYTDIVCDEYVMSIIMKK